MNPKFRTLMIMFLLLGLIGCWQWRADPQKETQDISPGLATSQILNPATERSLEIFPLQEGNAWFYEHLGFDQNSEVVWRIEERVVSTSLAAGYYIAEIERTAVLIDGVLPEDFPAIPNSDTFWYLLDGPNLYRIESPVSTNLSQAWLDLVLTFPQEDEPWYPDPLLRAERTKPAYGFRFASEPYLQAFPNGAFFTCYNIASRLPGIFERATFCEGMGVVYKESIDSEWGFGYRFELSDYLIQ